MPTQLDVLEVFVWKVIFQMSSDVETLVSCTDSFSSLGICYRPAHYLQQAKDFVLHIVFLFLTLSDEFLLFLYYHLPSNLFLYKFLKFQWGFLKIQTTLSLYILTPFLTKALWQVARKGGGGGEEKRERKRDAHINQQFSFMNKKIGRFPISIWGT